MPEMDFSFLAAFGGVCLVLLLIAFLAVAVPWWIWPLVVVGILIKGFME